jgi:diguanylate cyclase (GGDEF)-like protein
VLGGFWLGGETALILIAVGLPLMLALRKGVVTRSSGQDDMSDGMEQLIGELDRLIDQARRKSLKYACIFVELDDYDSVQDRHGQAAADYVINRSRNRLAAALRGHDRVFHMADGQFGISVSAVPHMDMDVAVQMATRLQRAVEEPISLDATTIYVSASVGLAISSQMKSKHGFEMGNAALVALRDARRHAPSAIRAYAPDMLLPETSPHAMTGEVLQALENGQIQPWFQPQISTDTGHVTGFEALARWIHPERGIIVPSEFLPVLAEAGKLERLGEVMLYHALHAQKSWDMAGLNVPRVGVNFAPDELRNPKLVEKIEWELDRFDLTPDRLMVEILETVVATSPDDVVARNINGLAALGCAIDLDDFGTGHASISSIRRFSINRLKIDRSFVMKVDRDPEQQRMVSAILLMADQLGLDTLAEGVETAGEHTMLAQLGCRHVQGFGISRPMPFDKTIEWVTAHIAKLGTPPTIGRKTG